MAGFWTEIATKRLIKLARENGMSAAAIGAELGCSRNAVIGKATRLGIALPGAARQKSTKWASGAPRSSKPRASAGGRKRRDLRKHSSVGPGGLADKQKDRERAEAAARAAALATVKPDTPSVPFEEAVDKAGCLWFAGDHYDPVGQHMAVCGAERAPGSRYCPFHARASIDETRRRTRIGVPA